MEKTAGIEVQLHILFRWGPEWGEWLHFHVKKAFNPGKKAPFTHWRADCVAPRPGLNVVAKRNISAVTGYRTRFSIQLPYGREYTDSCF
jgi:hypothetical protein